jgi:hypothetical protein
MFGTAPRRQKGTRFAASSALIVAISMYKTVLGLTPRNLMAGLSEVNAMYFRDTNSTRGAMQQRTFVDEMAPGAWKSAAFAMSEVNAGDTTYKHNELLRLANIMNLVERTELTNDRTHVHRLYPLAHKVWETDGPAAISDRGLVDAIAAIRTNLPSSRILVHTQLGNSVVLLGPDNNVITAPKDTVSLFMVVVGDWSNTEKRAFRGIVRERLSKTPGQSSQYFDFYDDLQPTSVYHTSAFLPGSAWVGSMEQVLLRDVLGMELSLPRLATETSSHWIMDAKKTPYSLMEPVDDVIPIENALSPYAIDRMFSEEYSEEIALQQRQAIYEAYRAPGEDLQRASLERGGLYIKTPDSITSASDVKQVTVYTDQYRKLVNDLGVVGLVNAETRVLRDYAVLFSAPFAPTIFEVLDAEYHRMIWSLSHRVLFIQSAFSRLMEPLDHLESAAVADLEDRYKLFGALPPSEIERQYRLITEDEAALDRVRAVKKRFSDWVLTGMKQWVTKNAYRLDVFTKDCDEAIAELRTLRTSDFVSVTDVNAVAVKKLSGVVTPKVSIASLTTHRVTARILREHRKMTKLHMNGLMEDEYKEEVTKAYDSLGKLDPSVVAIFSGP